MRKKLEGESCRTTGICVDSYEQGVPVGRFYNPGSGRAGEFYGLTRLLTELDGLLDDMALPQAFTAIRRFSMRAEESRPQERGIRPLPGKLATFSVRILFRQNASWQGSVKWMEGGMEESFRSVLELILLMDSVLSREEAERAG